MGYFGAIAFSMSDSGQAVTRMQKLEGRCPTVSARMERITLRAARYLVSAFVQCINFDDDGYDGVHVCRRRDNKFFGVLLWSTSNTQTWLLVRRESKSPLPLQVKVGQVTSDRAEHVVVPSISLVRTMKAER
jgi:hypothetical protein